MPEKPLEPPAVRRKLHETIAKVSDDYGRRQTFNTAIAAVMELCNDLARLDQSQQDAYAVMREGLTAVVKLLAPIVPHLSHALWLALGYKSDMTHETLPEVDPSALLRDTLELVVQVNCKVRAKIDVPVDASEEIVQQLALSQDNVQRFITEVTVRKIIVVPGRLVNIVAN